MWRPRFDGTKIGYDETDREWKDRATGQSRAYCVCALSVVDAGSGTMAVFSIRESDRVIRADAQAIEQGKPISVFLDSFEYDKGVLRGNVGDVSAGPLPPLRTK